MGLGEFGVELDHECLEGGVDEVGNLCIDACNRRGTVSISFRGQRDGGEHLAVVKPALALAPFQFEWFVRVTGLAFMIVIPVTIGIVFIFVIIVIVVLVVVAVFAPVVGSVEDILIIFTILFAFIIIDEGMINGKEEIVVLEEAPQVLGTSVELLDEGLHLSVSKGEWEIQGVLETVIEVWGEGRSGELLFEVGDEVLGGGHDGFGVAGGLDGPDG